MWDVDGTGLQRIAAPALAQAILDKVNAFNVKSAAQSVAAAALLAAAPDLISGVAGLLR